MLSRLTPNPKPAGVKRKQGPSGEATSAERKSPANVGDDPGRQERSRSLESKAARVQEGASKHDPEGHQTQPQDGPGRR